MPFQITKEPRLFRIVFVDEITRQDLLSLTSDISAIDRALLVAPNRLTDLRQMSGVELIYADVLTFVEHRKTDRLANTIKSAIVASMPVQLGFARMFQTINEHPQIEVRIFATLEEAEAWLAYP